MKNTTVLIAAILTMALTASANDYGKHFTDSTLRLDYILSGRPGDVDISLKAKHRMPYWAGRTTNLDQLHYTGNGIVTVTSLEGDTIYRNSFSSLFSEWLDLNDTVPQAHECTLMVPYPKNPVNVNVSLLDKRHQAIASINHQVDPTDILIKENRNRPLKHTYLHQGNYPGHRINIAIMGEGYRQEDMDQFMTDSREAMDAILAHEPFGEMKERFNFIAVETPSVENDVSVPKYNKWRDTFFKSHYSTFYSDRYLTSDEVFKMNDALNGIPFEHIIILVNSEEYGGGGIYNDYTLTTSHHPKFRPVVVHEFGHSFGGLADEYFYDGDVMDNTYPTEVEPWEPNITTLVDFGAKWEDMLQPGTPKPTPPEDADKYPVGLYEGGGYSIHGVYRPADNCRMRINEIDAFCPVCQKALRDLILYYTE